MLLQARPGTPTHINKAWPGLPSVLPAGASACAGATPPAGPPGWPGSFKVHIKVQHQQLGLLGAVAAAHGAHELRVGGTDAPHDPP